MTKIEWTDEVWNPVTGCTKVSEGCRHCYAERMSKRLAGRFGYPADDPFRVTLHPERLEMPLKWKKPRKIFVNSMSDLFHKDVPDAFIRDVFKVMQEANWHTFQVLTKRPWRMAAWLALYDPAAPVLRNVWVGVSVENQQTANERIPALLVMPAAVRFVSCEPMLGPVVIDYLDHCVKYGFKSRIDWVIVGGESGPGARPMYQEWVRGLRDQCNKAGVPFFFKQWGEWRYNYFDKPAEKAGWYPERVGKKVTGRLLDGREWNEMPR